MNTLVIYEYKAALYDVYHWIERFKDKIKSLEKDAVKDLSMDLGIIFKIKMDWDEEITIVPFNLLKGRIVVNNNFYDKIVIIGRAQLGY